MPPRKTPARRSRAADIKTFEDAVRAIHELQPDCPHRIYVSATHDLTNHDYRRSAGVTYEAACFGGGTYSIKATSPRDLVAKCITELFPRISPPPIETQAEAIKPLPGQRTFRLSGPGG